MSERVGQYRTYVDTSAGQVHARIVRPEAPSRAPLVCLHMSPMSSYVYRSILPLLGTDRVVVAFDTPGFGMSDPPVRLPAIADYAAVTAEVVRGLGLQGPVDILGYHTGSMTAAALAGSEASLVRRIIMIGAPVLSSEERKLLMEDYGPKPISEDGSHLAKSWQQFIQYSQGPGVTLQDVSDLFPERLLGRDRSWWGHRAAFDYDFAAAVAQVQHPILVLNPRDDLWEITPRIGPLLRNGSIVDLRDWGHGFLDTVTVDAVSLFRGFLDG